MSDYGSRYFEQAPVVRLDLTDGQGSPHFLSGDYYQLARKHSPAQNHADRPQNIYAICHQIITKSYQDRNPDHVLSQPLETKTLELETELVSPKTAEVIRVFDNWRPIPARKEDILRILLGTARRLENGNWLLALDDYRSENPSVFAESLEVVHHHTVESIFSDKKTNADLRTPKVPRHQHSQTSTTGTGSYLENYLSRSKSRSRDKNSTAYRHKTSANAISAIDNHDNFQPNAGIETAHKRQTLHMHSNHSLETSKPLIFEPITAQNPQKHTKSTDLRQSPGEEIADRIGSLRVSGSEREIPRERVPQMVGIAEERERLEHVSDQLGVSQAEQHYAKTLRKRALDALHLYSHWIKRQKKKAELGASFRRTTLLSKSLYNWHSYLSWGRSLFSLLNSRKISLLKKSVVLWKDTIAESKRCRQNLATAEAHHEKQVRARAWVAWSLFAQRERAGTLLQLKLEKNLKQKYFSHLTEEYDSITELKRDYGQLLGMSRRRLATRFFGVWWELSHQQLCERKAVTNFRTKTLAKCFKLLRDTTEQNKVREEDEKRCLVRAENYRQNVLVVRAFRLLFANYRILADFQNERVGKLMKNMLTSWNVSIKESKQELVDYTVYQRNLLVNTVRLWTNKDPSELASVMGFNKGRLIESIQSQAYCQLSQTLSGWKQWVTRVKSVKQLRQRNLLQNCVDAWKHFRKTEERGKFLANMKNQSRIQGSFSIWSSLAKDELRFKTKLNYSQYCLRNSKKSRVFASWKTLLANKHQTARRLEDQSESYNLSLMGRTFLALHSYSQTSKRLKSLSETSQSRYHLILLSKSFSSLKSNVPFSKSVKSWEQSCTQALHSVVLRSNLTTWCRHFQTRQNLKTGALLLNRVFRSAGFSRIKYLEQWETAAFESAVEAVDRAKVKTAWMGLLQAVAVGRRDKLAVRNFQGVFLRRRLLGWLDETKSCRSMKTAAKKYTRGLFGRSFIGLSQNLVIGRALKAHMKQKRANSLQVLMHGWLRVVSVIKKGDELRQKIELTRNTTAAVGSFSVWKSLFEKVKGDKNKGMQITKMLKHKFFNLWQEAQKSEKDDHILNWRRSRLFSAFKNLVTKIKLDKARLAESEVTIQSRYHLRLLAEYLSAMRLQSASRCRLFKSLRKIGDSLENHFERVTRDQQRHAIIQIREKCKRAKDLEKLLQKHQTSRRRFTLERCVTKLRSFTNKLKNQKQAVQKVSNILFSKQLKSKVFLTIRSFAETKFRMLNSLLRLADILEIQTVKRSWKSVQIECQRMRKSEDVCEHHTAQKQKSTKGLIWSKWFQQVIKRRSVTEKGNQIKAMSERSLISFIYSNWHGYVSSDPCGLLQRSAALASYLQRSRTVRMLHTLHSKFVFDISRSEPASETQETDHRSVGGNGSLSDPTEARKRADGLDCQPSGTEGLVGICAREDHQDTDQIGFQRTAWRNCQVQATFWDLW